MRRHPEATRVPRSLRALFDPSIVDHCGPRTSREQTRDRSRMSSLMQAVFTTRVG